MSLWTLQNISVTGETQWTNASYTNTLTVPLGDTISTQFLEVAGYTSGTISFTIDAPPTWVAPGLEINIVGGIQNTTPPAIPPVPISQFIIQTLLLHAVPGPASTLVTYYVEWNIPIQFVSLQIHNNTAGAQRVISNIILQTESEGGGVGFTSSSGATIGPGGSNPQMQFNNGGVFGGASGVLYNITVNPGPPIIGQVQLAAGTVAEPMLAFSDDLHPAGNYDTGIYRRGVNQLGISAGGTLECGISSAHVSAHGGTAATPGYNFGVTGTDTNTGMYRHAADAIGFSTGGAEKASIHSTTADPFIEGLNVGTIGDIAGIRRLSATAENSWEDGNCGNSEFIVFTASDFAGGFSNPVGGTGRQQTYVTRAPAGAANAVFSPVVYNAQTAGNAWACKLIPKGFILQEGGRSFIYSDVRQTTLTTPQRMVVDIWAQITAGPTIDQPVQLALTTVNQGPGGWVTTGLTGGSVNSVGIPFFINWQPHHIAAATGTGNNTVIVWIRPVSQMNETNGGIVAFKVPIVRI